MKAKAQSEKVIQIQICKYLQIQYPNVEYRTDKNGVRVGWKQIRTQSQEGGKSGFPDIIIPVPCKGFSGLVIELKKDGENPYKKDGTLKKDAHLEDQLWWLDWFKKIGCHATFSVGFEDTKKLIDWYLQ